MRREGGDAASVEHSATPKSRNTAAQVNSTAVVLGEMIRYDAVCMKGNPDV
jgi:hypothetical protein